jgi:hypothetical protein
MREHSRSTYYDRLRLPDSDAQKRAPTAGNYHDISIDVVMLREGGASSNHGERLCLLDRPLARTMTAGGRFPDNSSCSQA